MDQRPFNLRLRLVINAKWNIEPVRLVKPLREPAKKNGTKIGQNHFFARLTRSLEY
jgi:hypothetical protein